MLTLTKHTINQSHLHYHWLFIAAVICLLPTLVRAQSLLCEREAVSVYYVLNRTEEGKDNDEWRVYLDIENRGTVDLFYKVKLDSDPGPIVGNQLQLIPSYLTVTVLNAVDTYAGQPFYVHGSPTLHITSDTTGIYKVATKRFYKHITTRVKKGDTPQLTGEFTSTLLPLDQIKRFKLKRD